MKLRLFFEKKRILLAALLILATCVGSKLVPEVPLKFALVMSVLFAATACLRLDVRGWWATLVMGLFACAAALLTVLLCQFVNNLRGHPSEHFYLVLGCLCFLLAVLIVHLLLLCVSHVSIRPALILVSGALLVLAVANRFTYEFRGIAMTPLDLLGLRTAFHVAGKYQLYIDKNIWYAIVFYVLEIFLAYSIRAAYSPGIALRRIACLMLTLGLGVYVYSAMSKITPFYWGNGGAKDFGFVAHFARELGDSIAFRPKDYSSARIKELEEQYGDEAFDATTPEILPHVIVIMNESLADLRVFGEVETNEPVAPFLDSLQEDTVRGYALSSVYGGRTPNSEFEFLTGNSMAFYTPSMIAFFEIRKPCWSLARYLESLGYERCAAHPEKQSNWRRDQIWPLLGFSDCRFRDDYSDPEVIGDWVKDEVVYDDLIRRFEAAKGRSPVFLYTVTSQNHGAYSMEPGYPQIPISGYDSESVGAYQARIHESDRAFRKLVEYFEQVDEPVVILLYGDHQPNMETELLEYLHGGALESLDEQQLMYEIPYFIWANFDIEERRPELTSINYLSNDLLETAGLPLSPYNRFLKDVQKTIPAINAFGYYSRSEGRFQTLEEARGEEAQALLDYETLQYNAVNDKKGRSEFFFPVGD